MFTLLLPVCWDGLGRIGGGTLVSVGCPGLVNKVGPKSADLWVVQPTSGEAVKLFHDFCSLSLSWLGQRRARQQTQARRFEAGQAVPPPHVPQKRKGREAPLFFLAPASVGPAGRPGEERAVVQPADSRPALHSPRAGSGKRRLPPITASTASCQVPALASKVAAQTPHTHW